MSQLTYCTFTSHLPQGAFTGSALKGSPRALPVLLKDLEIKAISKGCGVERGDTERERRRKGCIVGPHQQAGELGAHLEPLKAINPIQNLLGTTSCPRLRNKSQSGRE